MRWLVSLGAFVSLAENLGAREGVILLHGLARTNASMAKLAAALRTEGYIVANVDYPSRTARIDELSEATVAAALRADTLQDCPRIHFVTHSLGGLLVRSYFARHRDPRLGRVVMLGPPNQGSEVADKLQSWWLYQKINGPAGGELGTTREAKPNQLGPVSFELGVIAGDRSVNWINSAIIPGPDDGKVSVERTKVAGMKSHSVVHVTHPFLMTNDAVIALTIVFLRQGAFSPDETLP